jgi:aminocarboxymuconate-semialdehyde decarboxylase
LVNRRHILWQVFGAGVGALISRRVMAAQAEGSSGELRQIMIDGKHARTIDIHNHCFVDIKDLLKGHEQEDEAQFSLRLMSPTRPFALLDKPANVAGRLQHMGQHGIDIQALSLYPAHNYWADPELAEKLVKRQNEKIAEVCSAHPKRFVGLGGVAMQHPQLAVEQMEYGVRKLGLRGFGIGGHVNGDELSAAKFDPFWAKAQELGVLLFLHPRLFQEGAKRFEGNGFLENVIGNPLETSIALAHLIFDGTLDRFDGLKICAVHGGGLLASALGRADHCAQFSSSCKPVKKLPSEYFKQQIYSDTIVFNADNLKLLISQFGASHIVLGTDFPADVAESRMGDQREADFIAGLTGISAADQRAILGENAAKLLGIPLS